MATSVSLSAPLPSPPSDTWLLSVMRSPNNRAMLASLENTLANFLGDTSQQTLPFPPKSDFFEKVARAVAARFRLAAHTEPVSAAAGAKKRIVLVKTVDSAVPTRRLAEVALAAKAGAGDGGEGEVVVCAPWGSDVVAAEGGVVGDVVVEKAAPSAVLKRPTNGDGRNGGRLAAKGGGSVKNVTEEEYETARARIFQKVNGNSAVDIGGIVGGVEDMAVAAPAPALPVVRVAQGPVEGEIGFGPRRRERGSGGSGKAASAESRPGQQQQSGGNGGGGGRRSNDHAAHAAQEADRHDPDFDRRYSKWQAPPSLLPIPPHQLYALQNQGGNFSSHAHSPPPPPPISDMTYQSLLSSAMQQHQHGFNSNINGNSGGVGHMPPMQAGHGFSGFSHLDLGIYGQLPNHMPPQPNSVGLQHHHSSAPPPLGSGMSPYPLQMPLSASGNGNGSAGANDNGAGQFSSMWLPSHTPQGEMWREQGFYVEPHVAKSSGVLRPASKAEAFPNTQPSPSQAQYGLESLNDFPELSNPP